MLLRNIEYNGKTIQVVEPPSGWCWDIINPIDAFYYNVENLKRTVDKEGAIKQAIENVFGEFDESNEAIKILIDQLS
jgi:hypothetical protein